MKKAVHYFKDLKADSTNRVLSLIRERAALGDISKIVVASTTGRTASAALEELGDEYKLVVVPHQFDFSEKDSNRFPEELTRRLREKGHSVHFGTMLFHTDKLFGNNTPAVAADFLRTFGEGTKVCIEIALMSCDAGLVSQNELVIAAAGTGRGLDTALVLSPGSSRNLNKMKISEIICKPHFGIDSAEIPCTQYDNYNEDILEAIFSRRSIREFDKKEISENLKYLLLKSGASAPSAHGAQPFKFAEISDRVLIERIVEKFPWFAPAEKSALNILVLGEPSKCVNREYWVADCAAATENILVAAQALGFGGVWMGIAPVENNIVNFSSLINLPEGLVPFSIIAIGYPLSRESPEHRIISIEDFMVKI